MGKKEKNLHVARMARRVLADSDGPVEMLEMECLIPKYGLGNVLQARSRPDIRIFPLKDIIMGPLTVTQKSRAASRNYQVEDYETLKNQFVVVKSMEINNISII